LSFIILPAKEYFVAGSEKKKTGTQKLVGEKPWSRRMTADGARARHLALSTMNHQNHEFNLPQGKLSQAMVMPVL